MDGEFDDALGDLALVDDGLKRGADKRSNLLFAPRESYA
jgi:hypothetical protein